MLWHGTNVDTFILAANYIRPNAELLVENLFSRHDPFFPRKNS